jgi:5-(carboxyamino)imidazole ribonucleotide synthase
MAKAPRIWVLGAGQLGSMLQQAGISLGTAVIPLDIHQQTPPELAPEDWVTAEREEWPSTAVTERLSQHPGFVNGAVFGRLADRQQQKTLLDDCALATAPWQPLGEQSSPELLHDLGPAVLLKRRTGGYDGKGQHWLRSVDAAIPEDWRHHAIAEAGIPFDEEVSLVGVRARSGQCQFFPLTLNLNLHGKLYATLCPVPRLAALQSRAEAMLKRLLDHLDYVGVMGMECFLLGEELIINELAPRVHNTGHWSQLGSRISQFEYHLRAILDMPLPAPAVVGTSWMLNLIGTGYNPQWREQAQVQTHWYGKDLQPGRKMGHINACDTHPETLRQQLRALAPLIPATEPYPQVFNWLEEHLTQL